LDKRWLIYLIPIAIGFAELAVGTSVSLSTQLVLVVLGFNVSLTLDLVREQIIEQRAKIRIITNESKLVEMYQSFKDKAVEECCLTWATKYKTPNLSDYFHKEKDFLERKAVFCLRRMITTKETNWNGEDIIRHLDDFNQLISAKKYELRETHTKGLEFVYADYKYKGDTYHRALFVLNDRGRKVGFRVEEHRSRVQGACANAIITLFESEWDAASKEPEIRARYSSSTNS